MIFRKEHVLAVIIVGAAIFGMWSCKKKGCSAGYWLNPDMTCRVRDENNGRILVEYFDLDTNELRLYLQHDGKELLIGHPYGKISSFVGSIDNNVIRFDPTNAQNLLVNGENFEIVLKQ